MAVIPKIVPATGWQRLKYYRMTSRCRSLSAVTIAAVMAALAIGSVSANDLYDATKTRDVNRVLALLSSGANPNERSPYDSPLHMAVRFGPPEMVIALLEAGANIELPGYGGVHPLHAAVLAGQNKIVSILLERGARVDALDNLGRTPLMTLISGE